MDKFLALFPVQASTHAAEVDQMTVLVHWLMLVLFVGWGLFFIFVLFRFRKSANPTASYVGAKGKISKGLEVAVALIEVVLLVFYAIPAWARRVKAFPSESGAVVVRVVAEQFAWNIHYPGPDGKFGRTDIKLVSADNPLGLDRRDPDAKDDITTINQLNLPTDRPVLVHLSSKDVIHSFGLYEMRVKQDAIPGMSIPVWFIPNRVGEYEIVCSQLCGLGHFRMRGFITIQTAADYQKWYDAQEKELQPAPATATAPTAP
jgi:cytochrome c oxidase subunit 2